MMGLLEESRWNANTALSFGRLQVVRVLEQIGRSRSRKQEQLILHLFFAPTPYF
jgi:hypothetical protein